MTKTERKAITRFVRAADKLVDAHNRLLKHDAGTDRARKAWENHDRCDEEYDAAKAALEQAVEASTNTSEWGVHA